MHCSIPRSPQQQGLGHSPTREPRTQPRAPSWLARLQLPEPSLLPPKLAWAGSWSQKPEWRMQPRHCNVGHGRLPCWARRLPRKFLRQAQLSSMNGLLFMGLSQIYLNLNGMKNENLLSNVACPRDCLQSSLFEGCSECL